MQCPLCFGSELVIPLTDYRHCLTCDLRFKDKRLHLNAAQEHERYLQHNNDVNDEGYRRFLEPLYTAVRENVPIGAHGLDFGAGPGPILTKLLRADGYTMGLYDPFFWPDLATLEQCYDFIIASEVVEHFYEPAKEFKRLIGLLKPGALLGIMTAMYHSEIEFEQWYYRRDPTHVVFYSRKTFLWIATNYALHPPIFKSDRLILLRA